MVSGKIKVLVIYPLLLYGYTCICIYGINCKHFSVKLNIDTVHSNIGECNSNADCSSDYPYCNNGYCSRRKYISLIKPQMSVKTSQIFPIF